MLHPVYGTPLQWFYPIGNTPAASLTQYLPPSVQANCLLLESGDPKNILFTLSCEQNNGKNDHETKLMK